MSVTDTKEDTTAAVSSLTARMKDPLVWAKLTTGIRIEDLQEKRFKEALDFLLEHQIKDEVLCQSLDVSKDKVSIANFAATAMYWMRDNMSLVAVEEGTGRIVGVLVARVFEQLQRARTFSRIKLLETEIGEAYSKIMKLRWYMTKKIDIFEHFKIDSYFRYYIVSVHPHHRGKGIGMGLFTSGLRLAETLSQPVVMGLFTSARSQALATKLGMTTVLEQLYYEWREKDMMIFPDTGRGNWSAKIMAMLVKGGRDKPLSIYPPIE